MLMGLRWPRLRRPWVEQADSIVRFDLADGEEEVLKPGERVAQVASPATIVITAACPVS
jgi:hypothetical protein